MDKATRLISVKDLNSGRTVIEQIAPVEFGDKGVSITLKEEPQEYFYGGGVQRTDASRTKGQDNRHREPEQLDRRRRSIAHAVLLVDEGLRRDVVHLPQGVPTTSAPPPRRDA